jgi:hypothetical protein
MLNPRQELQVTETLHYYQFIKKINLTADRKIMLPPLLMLNPQQELQVT